MYSGLAALDLLHAQLLYLGRLKLLQLLLVFLADLLQGPQGGVRLGFIELGHGEAHVDENPVPDFYPLLIVMNQADVYVPPNPTHLRLGKIDIFVQDLDYPARYPQTHASATPFPQRTWPPAPLGPMRAPRRWSAPSGAG